MHEFVVRGAELRMARVFSEPRLIDHRLRMLDTKTDRERFRLDVHAAPLEHAKRIA